MNVSHDDMTLPRFNVYEEIRGFLDDTEEVDVHEIARRLAAMVPTEELRSVLRQILPEIVRSQFSHHRMEVSKKTEAIKKSVSAQPLPMQDEPGVTLVSPRIRLLRKHALQQRLNARVHAEGGGYKLFRDCNIDDLVRLAGEARDRVAKHLAVALDYERYAKALKKAGAVTVGELPEETLENLMMQSP